MTRSVEAARSASLSFMNVACLAKLRIIVKDLDPTSARGRSSSARKWHRRTSVPGDRTLTRFLPREPIDPAKGQREEQALPVELPRLRATRAVGSVQAPGKHEIPAGGANTRSEWASTCGQCQTARSRAACALCHQSVCRACQRRPDASGSACTAFQKTDHNAVARAERPAAFSGRENCQKNSHSNEHLNTGDLRLPAISLLGRQASICQFALLFSLSLGARDEAPLKIDGIPASACWPSRSPVSRRDDDDAG